MKRGDQPVRGMAQPVVASAVRNAWRRKGWPPATASHAAGAIASSGTSSRSVGDATTGMGGATKGTGARISRDDSRSIVPIREADAPCVQEERAAAPMLRFRA